MVSLAPCESSLFKCDRFRLLDLSRDFGIVICNVGGVKEDSACHLYMGLGSEVATRLL